MAVLDVRETVEAVLTARVDVTTAVVARLVVREAANELVA